MAREQDNQRIALAEVERLLAAAERTGMPIPSWLDQLAVELRRARGPADSAGPDVAHLMVADPRLTLGAQANIDASALRILKS